MKKVTEQNGQEAVIEKRSLNLSLIAIIALSLISIISLSLLYFFGFNNQQNIVTEKVPEGVQAVFLTNGQVYFGEVLDLNEGNISLQNIYYLQSDKTTQPSQLDAQSDLKLIKLGNELHGPEDMMHINRDHVLFIEPLKKDSKVVKAIAEYTIK
ncbi:MAG: hypothetical protein P1P90_03585 [Patescibacteria group bacterium]|nr:hypothetical protein [Patescibacteria group bacterium]